MVCCVCVCVCVCVVLGCVVLCCVVCVCVCVCVLCCVVCVLCCVVCRKREKCTQERIGKVECHASFPNVSIMYLLLNFLLDCGDRIADCFDLKEQQREEDDIQYTIAYTQPIAYAYTAHRIRIYSPLHTHIQPIAYAHTVHHTRITYYTRHSRGNRRTFLKKSAINFSSFIPCSISNSTSPPSSSSAD